jgi:hypothetical protein
MINVIINREGIICGQCCEACPHFFEEDTEDERSQGAAIPLFESILAKTEVTEATGDITFSGELGLI